MLEDELEEVERERDEQVQWPYSISVHSAQRLGVSLMPREPYGTVEYTGLRHR